MLREIADNRVQLELPRWRGETALDYLAERLPDAGYDTCAPSPEDPITFRLPRPVAELLVDYFVKEACRTDVPRSVSEAIFVCTAIAGFNALYPTGHTREDLFNAWAAARSVIIAEDKSPSSNDPTKDLAKLDEQAKAMVKLITRKK